MRKVTERPLTQVDERAFARDRCRRRATLNEAARGYCHGIVSFRFLLVDDDWAKLGFFETETSAWAVGEEFVDDQGRRFAITAMIVNLDPRSNVVSTWTVEPA